MAVRIVRAVQTSIACPSQWDLWDADGNYYYARFRHGCGEVRQYADENWVGAPQKPDDEIDKAVPGWGIYSNTAYIRTVATFEVEDEWAGEISLGKLAEKTGLELDPQAYSINYGQHLRDELIKSGLVSLIEDPERG
jgi:hypothetical protein